MCVLFLKNARCVASAVEVTKWFGMVWMIGFDSEQGQGFSLFFQIQSGSLVQS
jgi:hypothetical protein